MSENIHREPESRRGAIDFVERKAAFERGGYRNLVSENDQRFALQWWKRASNKNPDMCARIDQQVRAYLQEPDWCIELEGEIVYFRDDEGNVFTESMRSVVGVPAATTFAVLKWMPHREYLKTDRWAALRLQQIEAYPNCKMCNSTEHLHIHHICYRHKPFETLECLVTLCEGCHKTFHNHRWVAHK